MSQPIASAAPAAATIDSAIVAAGANVAPRVTPADVEAAIDGEVYFTAQHGVDGAAQALELHSRHPGGEHVGQLRLLTFCVITLRNGFTVSGESACASPQNFNAEIGRRIARENAVAKIWPLLGFQLRSKLAEA